MKRILLVLKLLTKHKYFYNLLVFLITIPSFGFLLKPGYYNMHDDMQVIRQLEMETCLRDGQIPCRWSPDLGYGYGYPLFNFYPPLPYFVGSLFRLLNISIIDTVKYTAILQFILSAQFMFILVALLLGPLAGLLSSTLFTYAPYHSINIYIRGAMNEAWAATFFPLIIYFCLKLIDQPKLKNVLGLSLSLALLLLSHNPMVIIFAPIAILISIFCLLKKIQFNLKNTYLLKKSFLSLILACTFALGLSSFFTLPSIFETNLVQIESMFSNYYHYSVHFVSLFQLFISNYWNDGPSVWGPYDGMPFKVGYIHWVLPVFLFLFFSFQLIRKKYSLKNHYLGLFYLIFILAVMSLFMTHNRSTIIWKLIPTLQKLQFPWRFLNLSAFLLSLSSAWIVILIKSKYKKFIISMIIFLVLLTITINLQHFAPVKSGPITDQQKLSGISWQKLITSGIYDYLPKTAQKAPISAAGNFIDSSLPPDTYNLVSGKKGSDWQLFTFTLSQNSLITLSSLYFPNVSILDNGNPLSYSTEKEFGRITLSLPSGNHQIYLKYQNTPIRSLSNAISLSSWVIFLYFLIKLLWNNPRFKK